jgi:hypothetical protein
MSVGFLPHLDNLVERTGAIFVSLRSLIDIMQWTTPVIWDREHAWGNLGVDVESPAFIMTIKTIASNLVKASELIAAGSEIVITGPWSSGIPIDKGSQRVPPAIWPVFAPQHAPAHLDRMRKRRDDIKAQREAARDAKISKQTDARVQRALQDAGFQPERESTGMDSFMQNLRQGRINELFRGMFSDPDLRADRTEDPVNELEPEPEPEQADEAEKDEEACAVSEAAGFNEISRHWTRSLQGFTVCAIYDVTKGIFVIIRINGGSSSLDFV